MLADGMSGPQGLICVQPPAAFVPVFHSWYQSRMVYRGARTGGIICLADQLQLPELCRSEPICIGYPG